MYAVILLRSLIGKNYKIRDTLKMLNLTRKNHCVLIPENNPVYNGMLNKVRDVVTWGEINDETLRKLIEKRGREKGNIRLTKEEAEIEFNIIKEKNLLTLKKFLD